VDNEDSKIINSRFTLLHSAIEELARFRRNEYEGLLLRIEVLESRINTAILEAVFKGGLAGFVTGIFGALFFLTTLYFSGIKD
jgi:hypothetical protein